MFAAGTFLRAQDKFYTKTGTIFFRCTKSPLEKIEATNRSATCVLDTKTGSLQFAILVNGPRPLCCRPSALAVLWGGSTY